MTSPKLIETLDLKERHSGRPFYGGGEVARYIGRHGSKRASKAVLIALSAASDC